MITHQFADEVHVAQAKVVCEEDDSLTYDKVFHAFHTNYMTNHYETCRMQYYEYFMSMAEDGVLKGPYKVCNFYPSISKISYHELLDDVRCKVKEEDLPFMSLDEHIHELARYFALEVNNSLILCVIGLKMCHIEIVQVPVTIYDTHPRPLTKNM